MEQLELQPHSAAYFGTQRDFWWNLDFLQLMAKRLQLKKMKTVLDVGCGAGHWGRALSLVLSKNAHITGVEPEEVWLEKAKEIAQELPDRFSYKLGVAEKLPFDDASFDMVTCQTVLMHVPNVDAAIREMYRVLKPGGLFLAVEPNCFASQAIFDTISINHPVSEVIQSLEFYLLCEKGKQKLGKGFDSIGDLLPSYFHQVGLKKIQVYLCDKVYYLTPPYETQDQQLWTQQLIEWDRQELVYEDEESTKRCYLAGGGSAERFKESWQLQRRRQKEIVEAIHKKRYSSASGEIFYLVSGIK